MNPSNPSSRRAKKVQLQAEALETRQLLTGGSGNTLAIMTGTVKAAKDVASVPFTLAGPQFHVPKGKVTLGIDVVANGSSTFKPQVVQVLDPSGNAVRGTSRAVYNPGVTRNRDTGDNRSSALLAPLTVPRGETLSPTTFEAKVTGAQDTTGNFLVGFYLPGDANGDGVVDGTDVKSIRKAMGATPNDSRYTFDLDADRDGKINANDMRIAQRNKGVSTTVSPVVTANLDPATDSDVADRKTTFSQVHFTGTVTPGASVTFSDSAQKTDPVSTFANDKGEYSIVVSLAPGVNNLKVTTKDAFNQVISGGLEPVTRL